MTFSKILMLLLGLTLTVPLFAQPKHPMSANIKEVTEYFAANGIKIEEEAVFLYGVDNPKELEGVLTVDAKNKFLSNRIAFDAAGGNRSALASAKMLDWPAVKAAKLSSPTIDKFESGFLEWFKEVSMPAVNKCVEEAYRQREKSQLKATESAKTAAEISGGAFMVLPDNPDVAEMWKLAKETLTKIQGEMTKAVITSDIHKKYSGKILFSKKPIVIGKERESDFTTSFTASDKIYGVAYLTAGVADLTSKDFLPRRATISTSINGAMSDFASNRVFEEDELKKNISAVTFELIADPSEATGKQPEMFYQEVLKSLSPRKHKFKIFFFKQEGDFELDWTNANLKKIEADAALSTKNAETNLANARQLPDEFKENSFATRDFLTLPKVKQIIKASVENCKEVLSVVVSTGDLKGAVWITEKNELGVVLRRYTKVGYRFTMRGNDGNCYYYNTWGQIVQTHTGGGKYGEPVGDFGDGAVLTRIGCANLK
jgi:hypothetical protein